MQLWFHHWGCWSSVCSSAFSSINVAHWDPGKMPQGWRQRFCCTSCLVVEGSPTTHCSLTASNSQLRTEERARLKSTTLSTGEDRHNAVPLHRRRGAIRKGEFKSEKLEDRMRLRKETREQDSNPRVLLLFPSLSHIHYWRPGQPSAQHWQQIQGFLTRNWQPETQATLIRRKWQCQLWYKYLILYCTASDLIKGIMALIRLKLD